MAEITFPVAVDPVKDIVATRGLSHRALPTDGAFAREQVTTLITPGGKPASSAS